MGGSVSVISTVKQISRQNKNAVILLSNKRLANILPKLTGHLQTILTTPMDKIDVKAFKNQHLAFGKANFKVGGQIKPLFVLADAQIAMKLKIFQPVPALYAGKQIKVKFLGFKSFFDGIQWKENSALPGPSKPITLFNDGCGNFMEYEGGVHKVHFNTGNLMPENIDNTWNGPGALFETMFKAEKVDK